MGKLGNKRRSAQRPGKRERARVKSRRIEEVRYAPSGGLTRVRFGRKKIHRLGKAKRQFLAEFRAHLIGEPYSEGSTKSQTARL